MNIPAIHDLKVWLKYYDKLEDRTKTFEPRKLDRDYKVNDFLTLNPYDSDTAKVVQKGRQIAKVTYILSDAEPFGLLPGYGILGLKFWEDFTTEEKLIYRLVECGAINREVWEKCRITSDLQKRRRD